jgi:hypothetical protein
MKNSPAEYVTEAIKPGKKVVEIFKDIIGRKL